MGSGSFYESIATARSKMCLGQQAKPLNGVWWQPLFGLCFMEMIPSPRLGFLGGVFLANHFASNDNLTRTTKRENTYQRKLTTHKRGPNKKQSTDVNNKKKNLFFTQKPDQTVKTKTKITRPNQDHCLQDQDQDH